MKAIVAAGLVRARIHLDAADFEPEAGNTHALLAIAELIYTLTEQMAEDDEL
jgi:hypothetical protein